MRCLVPLLLAPLLASAADFHVSPQGDDSQTGSAAVPFATLAKARAAARPLAGKESVTIHLADGTYYLPEPLTLKAEDSGSESFPVVWKAEHEGKAILSGGLRLPLEWKPFRDGIFQAATPAGLSIDQLFIGGARQRMARYPNYDPAKPTAAYQGYATDAISKERAARWADPAGGYIHAMHVARWGGYHYRITGKNPDGTLAYEGGWQNNRQMGMHAEQRMVENIFEELDAPGEWFHNAKTNTLYFKPGPEIDLSSASVEVVRHNRLIDIAGTESTPVHHLTFQGFVIRHAARTFMENREPLLRSDWTIYRGGAVTLTGASDVAILDCEFDQPGGNAVFVNNFNRRVRIKGCYIHDTGASGVCFVGDPAAVRNPLSEYAQGQDLSKIDLTEGPKGNNYPADCSVEDCLITGIGRVERQPAGVEISMSARIALRDLSIYDCARAGINIGDGCWGGHLIERCDVFDTVLETHDHGSFNSWGRDRYWFRNHRGVSEPAVKKNPKLPYLDAVATNVIRDSRWRCDHGWDIDLDDGSSNYDIYRNLLLAGGLKFREGYGRKAHNNIIVNNGLHPHVWFDQSGDSLNGNILMRPHAVIGMPDGWQSAMAGNYFTDPAALAKCQSLGSDNQSIAIAPDFVDPPHGDYRLKEGSPALKAGFENFPMDQFGVKKPALKRLAKSPDFPALEHSAGSISGNEPAAFWLGAKLHGIEGEEFSAFGVAREDGGVQFVKVPADSAATKAGIRENDLLQSIQGRKVRGTKDLFSILMELRDTPLEIAVVRNQTLQTLHLGRVPYLLTEGASNPGGFKTLRPPAASNAKVLTLPATANEPVSNLTDGKLAANYGPVFRNGVTGLYKLDLGSLANLSAVNTWSFNQGGNRAPQCFTLYGSAAESDPGWNPESFTAIGSIDTRSAPSPPFLTTSLRAPNGESLGKFRWILWAPLPLNPTGENTAFQEFAVEVQH
ncbi:right-handed parallel beta-helix repeat-containing protein [Haloferula sp. BvORR071]|uniref:right-handed parallel beta-helix repeat-containing protein n=1 Tax=Haloferula sp. BvORR071 TaxID=1396141 RepID=UPI0006960A00|nr:right-handed parallel beta-helix repeat-containing protein [Haloferula sp. BvORR071]